MWRFTFPSRLNRAFFSLIRKKHMSLSQNFTKRMFRRVSGLVWNPLNGLVGIQQDGSIFTITVTDGAGQVDVCPIDSFGMKIPAFAMITPHDQVEPGDLVCGADSILGWVTAKNGASYQLMDQHGHNKQYTLPKVTMAGIEGAMVVKNLFGLAGGAGAGAALGGNLGMLLAFGGEDKLDDLLPLLLMSGGLGGAAPSAGGVAAPNPMASILPLMLLSKGGLGGASAGGSSMDKLLPLLMMGGLGGGAGAGMNPLMMMAMLGKGDVFGSADEPVKAAAPLTRLGPPPLQRL